LAYKHGRTDLRKRG